MHEGKRRYGENFKVAGKDGVHPGWAGQTLMAHAFLKGLGLDGDLGRIEVTLAKNQKVVTVGSGHEVVKNDAGEVIELRCTYDPATRSGQAPDGRKVQGTIHWVSAAQALSCLPRKSECAYGVPAP